MAQRHADISAKVHFATGLAVVAAAAMISYVLHDTSFGRHMEMTNLDAWFRFGVTGVDPRIAVVGITDTDYSSPVFHRGCPLPLDGVAKLIHAAALSGPRVIVVDLDTSDWPADARRDLQSLVAAAGKQLGLLQAPQLAWAVGGAEDTLGGIALQKIDAQGGCMGVPASIPDNYGVVRGYLPYIPSNGARVPSLAAVASRLYAGNGCAGEATSPSGDPLPPVDLIEYSGGPERFVHLTAAVVLGAAETQPWQNSNPLQGKIAVIGGQFREARDRYVTPAGYLDGVDILAHAIASAQKGGIPEPGHQAFLLSDLLLGAVLVTGSFFLHRFWVLAISFVAIPFVALAASFALYHFTGYFMSFMPILGAVFLHHLVEHGVEHWKLKKELHGLRAEVAQSRAAADSAPKE